MPQSIYETRSKRLAAEKPALIPLSDAKLKYAYLPDKVRNTVFKLIDKSALIDGRPLTDLDLDRTKAKVDVERLKKIDRVVNAARKVGTAGGYTDEEKKTVDAFMRDFPGKFKSFSEALSAHRKARETKDLTLGEEFKQGERDIVESVSSFVRPLLATQPGGSFVADVAGATAALPVSILEGIEFFTDPAYRAKVNPQGTSGGDYAGAALKLWLNVGAPGAGRILAPVGKAIGKGVENAGVKLVESGSLLGKPILQAKLAKEIDALEFGKELVKHGVPAKEAARTAYFATQAFKQSSAEDLDLAFSRVKLEQKALPGKPELSALPEPDPIRDLLRTGTGDDIASRLQTAPEQAIPPGGYVTREAENNTVRLYKGWYPFDDSGKPIGRVNRGDLFPAFHGNEEGVKVAGFFSDDPKFAEQFGKSISKNSSVGEFDVTLGRTLEIDATGKKAADIQFGASGKAFRDAVRSGKYDAIVIKNTADEGNVYAVLNPDNVTIRSHGIKPGQEPSPVVRGFGKKVDKPLSEAPIKGTQEPTPQVEQSYKTGVPVKINAYHATNKVFDGPLKRGQGRADLYFSDTPSSIRGYGERLYEADLDLARPLVVDATTHPGSTGVVQAMREFLPAGVYDERALLGGWQNADFRMSAKQLGFDSIVINNGTNREIIALTDDVVKNSRKAGAIKGTQESTPAKTPPEPQKPVIGQPGATEGGTVSHADVDALRKEFDLPARTQGAKPDTVLFDEANAVSDPLSVARESNVSGRILEDFEQIAVAGRIQAGRKSLTEARKTFESASGDAKIAAQSKIAVIEDDLLQMADAVDRTGTKGGRTQRARQIVADTINGGWDEGGIAYRFEKIAGKPKTPDKQKIVDQARRIEELETKLGKTQKSADSPEFKQRIASRLKSTKPPRNRLISDEARNRAVKRLRSGPRIGKQSGATTLPQDIVDLATVIAYEIETVGTRAFDDIYRAVKKELPEVSDADINIAAQHALDMIAKKPKRVTKAASRTMSDLKKEVSANLSGDDLKKARAALSTIEKTLKDPSSTLKQMDEAWAGLTKLRQKYNRGADEGLDTLVQGQVGYKSEEIADLRYEMDRVKQETYKDAARAKEKAFYESKPVIGKILHVAKIALTEPSKITRQLRSSVDISYPLRQGAWFNANPAYAKGNARAFKGMLKSLKTRDGYERAAYYIREHPMYQRFTESGGLLEGDLFGAIDAENFDSKLFAALERLTLKKNIRGPVQASGEAYAMAGNLQRLESFSNIIGGMERFGKAVPEWLAKDVAEYTSQGTGRGQTRITELLKHISSATLEGLWSPKLVGSRFELVTGQPLIKAAGKAAVKGDWRLARVIMRDYIAFGSMMGSIYAIAKAAGAEVNLLNYNDPDWGKIVIGPLHIDLLAGMQQAARFMLREYDAIMRSLRKEDHAYGQDPLSLAVGEKGFVRTKLSPLHGEIANWFAFGGEDILGREVTPLSTLGNLTIPLAFGEAYGEEAKAHPVEAGVATALQQVGAGASVYEKDTSSTGRSHF